MIYRRFKNIIILRACFSRYSVSVSDIKSQKHHQLESADKCRHLFVLNSNFNFMPSFLSRVPKTPQKLFLKEEKEAGEAHLLGEIILQLRNKQDQHDDATDDGHCRHTRQEGLLESTQRK